MILRAILYTDRAQHRADQVPGSIWFSDPGDGDVVSMFFWCPSGAKVLQRITLGIRHKPPTTPSWKWDGNPENPTLHPSVKVAKSNLGTGWHGYLVAGYWRA